MKKLSIKATFLFWIFRSPSNARRPSARLEIRPGTRLSRRTCWGTRKRCLLIAFKNPQSSHPHFPSSCFGVANAREPFPSQHTIILFAVWKNDKPLFSSKKHNYRLAVLAKSLAASKATSDWSSNYSAELNTRPRLTDSLTVVVTNNYNLNAFFSVKMLF